MKHAMKADELDESEILFTRYNEGIGEDSRTEEKTMKKIILALAVAATVFAFVPEVEAAKRGRAVRRARVARVVRGGFFRNLLFGSVFTPQVVVTPAFASAVVPVQSFTAVHAVQSFQSVQTCVTPSVQLVPSVAVGGSVCGH